MGKPANRRDALLASIKRLSPEAVAQPTAVSVPDAVAPKKKTGSASQYWLHDEDRRIIRELSAWLAGQGQRPTDSMVIRAALRLAKTGNTLLDAYREASKLDGRIKRE